MRRLLIGTALVWAASGAAVAQCAPDGAPGGSSVTCTADDPNGYSNANGGLSISVDPGVTVSSTSGDVFRIRGAGNALENFGTIDSRSENDAIDGGAGLTVVNRGSITSDDRGINTRGQNGATITNAFGASIVTDGKALRIDDDNGTGGDDNLVHNAGLIQSLGEEAIEGADDNTIINEGTIIGFDDAINVGRGAFIANSGTIRSTGTDSEPQDAIDLDSGTILNGTGGLIESLLGAAIDFDPTAGDVSVIQNHGRISGQTGIDTDPADAGQQHIDNAGVLEGLAGVALNLGLGDDSFTAQAGSTVTGSGLFGGGNDALAVHGTPAGKFGGEGAIWDGGEGSDHAGFFDLMLDTLAVRYDPLTEVFTFRLDQPGGAFRIALVNWESFTFGQTTLDREALQAIAAVPLPAGALLLGGGLGALALTRRRRGRAVDNA